jgi:hypothetical protein
MKRSQLFGHTLQRRKERGCRKRREDDLPICESSQVGAESQELPSSEEIMPVVHSVAAGLVGFMAGGYFFCGNEALR